MNFIRCVQRKVNE